MKQQTLTTVRGYMAVFFLVGTKVYPDLWNQPYEHRAANRLRQDRARKHVMNNYQRKDLGGNAVPTVCYFYHPMSQIRSPEYFPRGCNPMGPSTDLDTLFKGFVSIKKTLL